MPDINFLKLFSGMFQVVTDTKNEQGVLLVSGCTPRLFSMIADGSISDMAPYEFMMEVLMSERYEKIAA